MFVFNQCIILNTWNRQKFKMHINDFPVEVLGEIFSYLCLEDLSSCCLTNKLWRQIINNDKTWEKLCTSRFLLSNKYMPQQRTSVVEPRFVNPKNTFEELSNPCKWRINYMKQAHIRRNLRRLNYVKIPLEMTDIQCLGDILVDRRFFESAFFVYKINSSKLVRVQVIPIKKERQPSNFKLLKDKIVYVNHMSVYVFSMNKYSGLFELTSKFLFNKDTEGADDNELEMPLDDSDLTKFPTFACDENHFVGFLNDLNLSNCEIHVWDLNSHQKLHQKIFQGTFLNSNEYSLNLNMLYLKTKEFDGWYNVICYQLNELNPIYTYPYSDVTVFTDKLIIGVCKGIFLFFADKENGKLLHSEEFNYIVCKDAIYVIPEASVVLIAGCSVQMATHLPKSIVRIMNTETFQTIYEIEFNVKHFIRSAFYIPPNIAIISCCSKFCKMQFWDVVTKTRLGKMKGYCHWVSPSRSKILLEDIKGDLKFLNFW